MPLGVSARHIITMTIPFLTVVTQAVVDLCCVHVAIFLIRNPKIQSGILFQREQNIILSSHTWTVFLHFNLTEIKLGKESLEANLAEVRRTVEEYSKISSSKNKFQDLLESLETVNSRLGTDLQTIIDMIPQSKRRRKRSSILGENLTQHNRVLVKDRFQRELAIPRNFRLGTDLQTMIDIGPQTKRPWKRSSILGENLTQHNRVLVKDRFQKELTEFPRNFRLESDRLKKPPQFGRQKRAFTTGGKLIKFLFGNPDEDDRKKIFSNLHKLNINHKNIIMNTRAQSLVISDTEETIAKALRLLESLSENVTDFNRKFQDRVNANERNMSIVLDKLLHENNIEVALTSLVYFSIETQHAITEFRNAIQTSLSHVLSPILIPSDVLIEILERIRNCLEKPLELIVPGTHATVHTYYELSKVSLSVEDEELIITVTLPISDVSGQFQMYKIVSIPWLMNKTDIFVQWEVADYFIIDESRKFHAAINTAQREKCRGKQITICPISMALYTEASPVCEYSLFMGEHNPLCMKTVDKLKNNIIKSIPSAWVVSVVQPTSLTLICPNHTVYNEKVDGSFLIKNATNCEILSRHFKLQRVIGSNMTVQANFRLLAIPKIHILNEEEKFQVIEIGVNNDLTDKIKSVIEQNEKATSFSAMLHEVTKYYSEPMIKPMTAFAGTISVYSLAVGISVLILFFKFRRYIKRPMRNTAPQNAAPRVTLNVKHVGVRPREVAV